MLKNKQISLLILFLAFVQFSFAQIDDYQTDQSDESFRKHQNSNFHNVQYFKYEPTMKKATPKNIILFIGDGMGLSQIFAGLAANKGHLFIENFKNIGFSKTQSTDDFITDSAAGGTAIATGTKTHNGAIGVDSLDNPVTNIIELAEKKRLATGLLSTSSVTHATPASFIAHQESRNDEDEIALDFLKTDIDVFIGGGSKFFNENKAGNLIDSLKKKNYQVLTDIKEIAKVISGKLAGLTAKMHNPRVDERGEMLKIATRTAINILSNNNIGFFVMIEGSQIDWAHISIAPIILHKKC